MQIISMYIQNHYIKNYMPSHKLNQAKNTSYQLKKKKNYVHFQMSLSLSLSFFNKSLSVSPPIYKPPDMRAHTDTRLCTSLLTLEHSDKQMSLWLV